MYKAELKIDGMACGMCEAHVNDTIRNHMTVKKIKSSWKKGTTTFLCEDKPDEEELKKVLDPTGYKLLECSVSEG